MSPFVLDVSVAAAWWLTDESSLTADAVLDRLENDSALVPSLFWYEIRHVLLTAERRARTDAPGVAAALAHLAQLPIRVAGEPDSALMLALARSHRLSAYDASYLALARAERLPLATLDGRLAEAARHEGLSVSGSG